MRATTFSRSQAVSTLASLAGVALSVGLAACSGAPSSGDSMGSQRPRHDGDASGPTFDGGADAKSLSDAANDVAADHAAPEGWAEAGPAPGDASDATTDAAIEAEIDSGIDDGATDSRVESGIDSGPEAGGDAAPDTGADPDVDAGCSAAMGLFGGSSSAAFGATWSSAVWTSQTLATSSLLSTPSIVPFGGGWVAVGQSNANALVSSNDLGGTWTPAAQIATATTMGPPALAVLFGSVHAVYLGLDAKYYHATYATNWDDGTDPVGGSGASQDFGADAPTVATAADVLYVAFAGGDSNLHVRPYNGAWQPAAEPATSLDGSVSPRIVALTGSSADLLVVFSRSGDDVLEYVTRDASSLTWSSAALLSGTTTLSSRPVSMTPLASGGAYLLFQGLDGKPYTTTYTGGAWTPAAPLLASSNPVVASPPQVSVGVCGDDAEVVYVLAADSSVHVARIAGGVLTDASPASTVGSYASIASAP
jgi:hypothetical protein